MTKCILVVAALRPFVFVRFEAVLLLDATLQGLVVLSKQAAW